MIPDPSSVPAPVFHAYWKPFRLQTTSVMDVLPFHSTYMGLLHNCETLGYLIRSYATYSMTCAGLGHPGGSFSEAEILAVLYNYVLRFDATNPQWPMRDVFYLSKCHSCPGLYTVLALFGYFPVSDLKRYGAWGSHLESHPDWTKTPGIEISGGSLGQIPGVAVGRAIALRRNGPDHADRMVYVLLGDGECNEGSVWEAFMAASHYRLDNLVVLIDYNKVQAKGVVSQDMTIEPLAAKLAAFGLDVLEVQNGHDVSELVNTFTRLRQQRRGKPLAIILNTVKGKKVNECQYNPNWHTSAPRDIATAAHWLEEIWIQDGRRLGISEEFLHAMQRAIEIVLPVYPNPDQVSEKQA
jgi:transketolase